MASATDGPPDSDKIDRVFQRVKDVGTLAYYARCQAAEASQQADQAKKLAARAKEQADSVNSTAESLTMTAKMVAKLALEQIVEMTTAEPAHSPSKSAKKKQQAHQQQSAKKRLAATDVSTVAENVQKQIEKLDFGDEEYSRLLQPTEGELGEEGIPRGLRNSWERIKGDVESLPDMWKQYCKLSGGRGDDKRPSGDNATQRCRSASRRCRGGEESEQAADVKDDFSLDLHV